MPSQLSTYKFEGPKTTPLIIAYKQAFSLVMEPPPISDEKETVFNAYVEKHMKTLDPSHTIEQIFQHQDEKRVVRVFLAD